MNIEIKKATREDADELVKMYREIHDYHLPFDPLYSSSEDYADEVGPMVEKDLEAEGNLILIAKVDEKYAGFGIFKVVDRTHKSEKTGFIRKAFVRDEFRGKGLFKQIYSQGETWLKEQGVNYLELSCDSNNDLGQKTWGALGFEEVKKTMRKKI
jgi:GNAT superfamily N-acetyltransferase